MGAEVSCNKEGGSGPLRAPAAGAPASLGKGKPVMHPEYGYAYSMVHGVVFPPFASEEAIDEMRKVDWSQENDIMIATYPKCGTTWMQQIVLLLLAKGDASKVHDPMVQSPWVDREFSIAHTSGDAAKKAAAWDMLNAEPDPAFGRRVFKTHAPWQLHPCGGDFSKGKFICITRNPKDAALSMHKHYLGLPPFRYTGPWSHFYQLFMEGNIGQGSWFDHVLSWRTALHDLGPERVFFITFEEMKKDPIPCFRKLVDFLGIEGIDDEILAKVAGGSSFDSMKAAHEKREVEGARKMGSANHFRSGKSGGWRDVFTVTQSDQVEEMLMEKMEGCDDVFVDFGKGVKYQGAKRI